ncbi:acyl carrier protein [Micromonospora parva]|uniref:acyl carrier protein n=1 Tax=Micromonospora parva TaxID=1464048 RepID=UPI0033F10ABE
MTLSTGRSSTGRLDEQEVEQTLLAFLGQRTKSTWEPQRDLFAVGGLSSLFAMELVVFIENTFSVSIGGSDLRLDNFRTVSTMVALVTRLRSDVS